MKFSKSLQVKDLIVQLQKLDPEAYVNGALSFVDTMPAWYDGSVSFVNEEGKWVSTRSGKFSKLNLYYHDFYDLIYDNLKENPKLTFDEFLDQYCVFDTAEARLGYYKTYLKEWNETKENFQKESE